MAESHEKTENNQELKVIIALIAASITPAIILSIIVYFVIVLIDYREAGLELIVNTAGLGLIVFIVAFMHTFLLGMPLFFLGSRLNLIRWWTILLGSSIVGSMPCGFLIFLYNSTSESLSGFSGLIEMAGFMGLCGLSGGITFWLLWRYWIQEKPSNNLDAEN